MRISDWSSTCALPIYIMTELAISIRLDMPFAETVDATREALSEQGFGILTEIDMQSTLKAKIDADIERYVILGACNPRLAKSAIDTDRQVGLDRKSTRLNSSH